MSDLKTLSTQTHDVRTNLFNAVKNGEMRIYVSLLVCLVWPALVQPGLSCPVLVFPIMSWPGLNWHFSG